MSTRLSVVIITRDEERRLPDCLDSVVFADEIVVVDSGSRDGTVALAEARGCHVVRQEWLGYGPQKRFAVDRAANDWVLCLDADERVSDDLAGAIRMLLATPPPLHAYAMPRRNRFLGRWLRHGEGYPDWSLRLFDRRHARWSDDPVHEGVVADGPHGRLHGDLLHESQESLERYLAKQNHYTTLQAQRMFERGRRVGRLRIVASPLLRFVKMYVVRFGFLDGFAGLVHILIGCANTATKYLKLYELQQREAGRHG